MQAKERAQDHLSGTTHHIIPYPHRSVFAGSEREVLQEDDHGHFQGEESKPHSYAVPGASPERQEGVGVNRLLALFREPDHKKEIKLERATVPGCVKLSDLK